MRSPRQQRALCRHSATAVQTLFLSFNRRMACNPTLCPGPGGVPVPACFAGEQPLLLRDGIDFELDGLEYAP